MGKAAFNQEYSVATEGEEIQEGTRGSRAVAYTINGFFMFSIALSVALVAFSIIFFLSVVEGPSMMQTINAGYNVDEKIKDSVLINRFETPQRGDIIITKYYWDKTSWRQKQRWERATALGNVDSVGSFDYFIKRLIAIEGDHLRFERRSDGLYDVILNGEKLNESYLHTYWGKLAFWDYPYEGFNSKQSGGTYEWFEITIPEGMVFFMGDNRGSDYYPDYRYNSFDCREVGPQPKEYIQGTVKDIVKGQESMPEYVWRKISEFVLFWK